MSPGALIDRMDRAGRAQHAALVEELEAVAAFDERRLWRADGATSMTAWLAARRAISWPNARELVRVARALRRCRRSARRWRGAGSPSIRSGR